MRISYWSSDVCSSDLQDAAPPLDVADDVHHLGNPGALAALIDDRKIGVKRFGDGPGAHHAAHVGRDDGQVALAVALHDVLGEHRRGEEVVGRDVEEALDLAGVTLQGTHRVGAGRGDQVEFGGTSGRERV